MLLIIYPDLQVNSGVVSGRRPAVGVSEAKDLKLF